MIFLIFLTALCGSSYAVLPSFIIPCKNDAKLVECTIKNANLAIPKLIPGDPKSKLPPFDPLFIKELAVTENSAKNIALNFTFTDLNIIGLKDTKLVDAVMDTKNKHFEWVLDTPKLVFKSKYKISGKFLILPITGNGPSEITLEKTRLTYKLDYKTFSAKGKTFMKVDKTKLEHKPQNMKISLKNLFNGDKALSDNMNAVLNENWQEFDKQLGASVAEGVNLVLRNLIEIVSKNVPFNDIVKP